MNDEHAELDRLQREYKAAVDAWIMVIRAEEELASVNHTVADIDRWESAHFAEETARGKAKAVKREYESALRSKFFGF
jgi:hypothetical protein